MDTTDYPSLGRLAAVNAQLLVHNRAVAAVVHAQLDDAERLFRAAAQRDWEVVLRISETLARQHQDRTNRSLIRRAEKVCETLRRDPSGAKAGRQLGALLVACRDAKVKKK